MRKISQLRVFLNSPSANSVKFDRDGVLLAAGTANGYINLFDFDEYSAHSKIMNNKRNLVGTRNTNSGADTDMLEPVHSVQTGFQVEEVQWSPSNQSHLAACFCSRSVVRLFDLERAMPIASLRGSGSYIGNASLAFAGENTIVAGSKTGCVRVWDCRSVCRRPAATSHTASFVPATAVCQQGYMSSVNAVIPHSQHQLFTANAAGCIDLWDLRRSSENFLDASLSQIAWPGGTSKT